MLKRLPRSVKHGRASSPSVTRMLDLAKELFDLVLAGRIVGEPKQIFALDEAAAAHQRARIAFNQRRDRAHTIKKI